MRMHMLDRNNVRKNGEVTPDAVLIDDGAFVLNG